MATYTVPLNLDAEAVLVQEFTNKLHGGSGGLFQIAAPQIKCRSLQELKILSKPNLLFVAVYFDRHGRLLVNYISQNGIFVLIFETYLSNPINKVINISRFDSWETIMNKVGGWDINHDQITFSIEKISPAFLTEDAGSYLVE